MIDKTLSYRKNATIVVVHSDTSEAPCQHCNEMETHLDTCIMRTIRTNVVHTTLTEEKKVFKSINQAKLANRQTQYRVVRR